MNQMGKVPRTNVETKEITLRVSIENILYCLYRKGLNTRNNISAQRVNSENDVHIPYQF